MKLKTLTLIAGLGALVSSCRPDQEVKAAETPPERPKGSSSSQASTASEPKQDGEVIAPSRASDRSNPADRKPPVADRIDSTHVKSPFTGKPVDIVGLAPGTLVKDPASGKDFTVPEEAAPLTAEEARQNAPTATPVPGKPGYVFSPFSNKVIDVEGIPEGKLVSDPNFPASEHKYFKVPASQGAPAPDGQ